jgi:hypothetical protein
MEVVTLYFLVLGIGLLWEKPNSFSGIWYNDVLLMGISVVGNLSRRYSRH